MTADQIFIVVTAAVAALLGIGALLAAARRRQSADQDRARAAARREAAPDKYELAPADAEALVATPYETAVRVLWWVSIALVLIGVVVTDAFAATRPAIALLAAAGVGVVVLVHDLLPARARTRAVAALEVVAALAIISALLTLTGFGSSPFAYALALVAVAVALAGSRASALIVAAAATLAFLGVLWIDPARPQYGNDDLLRFGLTIGSIWLLAYLASVFASAEREMRSAVERMSRIDPLTALFNSSQLYPMLEQEVQRTRRSERGFCLLMIDLDGLKAVNDSYGHHRGDEVLRALGEVIRGSIRNLDTAYRIHGDEFMVLLPETDFVGAFVVAEKIRAGAEDAGLATGTELPTSVSIGLVSCPEDGTSADELMIAADRAMYQAKSLGKNQISGNPRPRRLAYRPPEEPAAVAVEPARVTAVSIEESGQPATVTPIQPEAPAPPSAPAVEALDAAEGPSVPAPVPVAAGTGVGVMDAEEPVAAGAAAHGGPQESGEEEPDPSEVRRQIAAAQRNMDPDHQIRRAMDAFLSPGRRNGD
ncbi:MAG TPA: GGDEF domain-containing protein [Candidatus Limnocylindria bacterium]|nr:GGDEF domain-containing protein [Candidatus Limnocylindria bacterium]